MTQATENSASPEAVMQLLMDGLEALKVRDLELPKPPSTRW